MGFSIIRPKPPKKTVAPPPASAAPAPTPASPPEPIPRPPVGVQGPCMEEMDCASRIHRSRSMEYTIARTWRVNYFGDSPNNDYYNTNNYCDYAHYPVGAHGNYGHPHYPVGMHGNYGHPYQIPAPAPMALPPLNYYHGGLPGPPQRLGLPPPDYHHHHGPPGFAPPPPYDYYGGAGFFSDENPHGCRIM